MKKIFFVLIPKRKEEHTFGGLLVCKEQIDTHDIAKEVGGTYVPSTYSLN